MQSANTAAVFLAFVIGLGLLYGTIYGPLAAFWSELFDTRYRYTALSTLYQISGVVASGLTPLIAIINAAVLGQVVLRLAGVSCRPLFLVLLVHVVEGGSASQNGDLRSRAHATLRLLRRSAVVVRAL